MGLYVLYQLPFGGVRDVGPGIYQAFSPVVVFALEITDVALVIELLMIGNAVVVVQTKEKITNTIVFILILFEIYLGDIDEIQTVDYCLLLRLELKL